MMRSLTTCALFLVPAIFIPAQISAHWLSYLYMDPIASGGEDACKGVSPTNPGPVADPENCKNFYFCVNDGIASPDFSLSCGEEYECFDPNATPKSMCSTDPVACEIACLANSPVCKYECLVVGEVIADQEDCRKYYFCGIDNEPLPAECGEDEVFNGNKCVTDKSQCCKCKPRSCDDMEAGTLLLDTADCRSFYTCLEVDESGDLIPVGPTACPEGTGFNSTNGNCDSFNKECEPICPSNTTPAPTTDSVTSDVSSTDSPSTESPFY